MRLCVGGVIPDLVSSGSNSTWYSDVTLTNVVGTNGTSFSTGQTSCGCIYILCHRN